MLDRVRAWGDYHGDLRELIHAFKFDGNRRLASWLADRLAEVLQEEFADETLDAVIPIPLHPARRRERGFDQTRLLARGLSRRAGIPVWRVVCRDRHTRPQMGLNRRQRLRNVSSAFSLAGRAARIKGSRLLVVDDILTTGATVEEVAGVLRLAGARWVGALVVARVQGLSGWPGRSHPD